MKASLVQLLQSAARFVAKRSARQFGVPAKPVDGRTEVMRLRGVDPASYLDKAFRLHFAAESGLALGVGSHVVNSRVCLPVISNGFCKQGQHLIERSA